MCCIHKSSVMIMFSVLCHPNKPLVISSISPLQFLLLMTPLFWNDCFNCMAGKVDVGVVICAEIGLCIWDVLPSYHPILNPFIPVIAGHLWSLQPSNHYSTSNSCKWSPLQLDCDRSVCISLKNR